MSAFRRVWTRNCRSFDLDYGTHEAVVPRRAPRFRAECRTAHVPLRNLRNTDFRHELHLCANGLRKPCWRYRVGVVGHGSDRSFCTLRWTQQSALREANPSFARHYFDDENVLFLYVAQRSLLSPKVDEQVQMKANKQHIDLVWHLGGEVYKGSGVARSKKAARREAARHLLRRIPVSHGAASQALKQIVNSLRVRIGAEIVADSPEIAQCAQSKHAHAVVWRIPQERGKPPLELSVRGIGSSAEEARFRAMESLYESAQEPRFRASAATGAKQRNIQNELAGEVEAQTKRHALIDERLSLLSQEAAGEIVARHNHLVQRRRIDFKPTELQHSGGFHCSLEWRWRDEAGRTHERKSQGLGSSKRVARGEAMQAMLVSEGFSYDLSPSVLNEAARIRVLAKNGSPEVIPTASAFLHTQEVSAWSLALPDAWEVALKMGDRLAITSLGRALHVGIRGDGLPPSLFDVLLDSCVHVASKGVARIGLGAISGVPISSGAFPSDTHRDYYRHFRQLIAWERVGQNEASIEAIKQSGDEAFGLVLEQSHCLLPYLTLEARGASIADLLLADIRAQDVVFVQPCSNEGHSAGPGHLATVTTVGGPKNQGRLTLRCTTLVASDVEGEWFKLHGLDSETTALRMIAALRALAAPVPPLELRGTRETQVFSPALEKLLVGSFKKPTVQEPLDTLATSSCEQNYLELVKKVAADRGMPMTEAQEHAVRSSLEQRLTLIHGPPGTGKTTAASFVVLAWRASAEKILCATDSNGAADRLHASLEQMGIKALRFGFGGTGSNSGSDQDGGDVLGSMSTQSGSSRRGHRGARTGDKQNTMYQRLVEMQNAVAQFQIVVTTCGSAGHDLLKDIRFPRVLIDECTQSVEPATLIPLSHGCERAVLIGDHRQLPPTVVTPEAEKGGLARSLFSRFVECRADRGSDTNAVALSTVHETATAPPLVLLDQQRRMHPSIAEFPNTYFYGGQVRDVVGERLPIPGLPWPWRHSDTRVLLVDTGVGCDSSSLGPSGDETMGGTSREGVAGMLSKIREERLGTSWQNSAEAQCILKIVAKVLQAGNGETGAYAGGRGTSGDVASFIVPEEVAIITPYNSQKRLLQRELRVASERSPDSFVSQLNRIRVSTIDGFQGSECDLVVFSAVRSNSQGQLGFLQDVRRANVLLTRARRGLVVVADASTMRQAHGSVWAHWLSWVEARGAVVPLDDVLSGEGSRFGSGT